MIENLEKKGENLKKQASLSSFFKALERFEIQILKLRRQIKELDDLVLSQNNHVLMLKRQIFQQNVAINELFKQLLKHLQEKHN